MVGIGDVALAVGGSGGTAGPSGPRQEQDHGGMVEQHLCYIGIYTNKRETCTMAFSELLQHMGNFGRYQIMLVFSTSSLTVLLVTHNLVENFSGAIPAHRCYVHLLDNITSESKHPENLTTEALLRISIPMGVNNELEQCRRFRQTQWQLLNSSDLATNTTELETEACLDGWIYDQSIFTSTIVTQWNLVCKSKSLKFWSQSIFMAGFMLGSLLGGYISDKWTSESVRWLIVSGKLEKALKVMKKVAHTNGKKDVEETLNIEVLQSAMREELTFLKHSSKKIKVMASPIMCKTLFLLFFLRSRAEGGIIFMTGLASSLSSLTLITRQYFEHLPTILFGTFPIVAAICVYFLPETLNLPLPDTIQDVERRHKNYKKTSTNEEESNDLQGTTEC
ncbi:Solute carrier family 22 member 9 [Myotis brandtii]|uniref:Solute carrier family 22 member 9 n=1 Tax=Myotis brandtii TaxID=109478 RepID=S7MEM6_MYOBR|nr:Solute carrier family 22 member 9 [Myotis brandtii]